MTDASLLKPEPKTSFESKPMAQVDIPFQVIIDLKEVLEALDQAAEQHEGFHPEEEIVEPWSPSDSSDDMIECPLLNVALLRKAQAVKKSLKL